MCVYFFYSVLLLVCFLPPQSFGRSWCAGRRHSRSFVVFISFLICFFLLLSKPSMHIEETPSRQRWLTFSANNFRLQTVQYVNNRILPIYCAVIHIPYGSSSSAMHGPCQNYYDAVEIQQNRFQLDKFSTKSKIHGKNYRLFRSFFFFVFNYNAFNRCNTWINQPGCMCVHFPLFRRNSSGSNVMHSQIHNWR